MEKETLVRTFAVAAGLTSCAILLYNKYFQHKDDKDDEDKIEY